MTGATGSASRGPSATRHRRAAVAVAVAVAVVIGSAALVSLSPARPAVAATTTAAATSDPPGTVSTFTGPGIFGPDGIVAGPDGNLWFANRDNDSIGKITPQGVVTNHTGPGISYPQGITAGPDGNLWFTNTHGNSIGRITPAGVVTNHTDPSISAPSDITAGPDGNLWFTNNTGHSIGRITAAGVVTVFPALPFLGSIDAPLSIVTGPDGNLWFTDPGNLSIGRITPTGTVLSSFSGAGIGAAFDIAVGPDGNLWFANWRTSSPSDSGSIGRITPTGVVTTFSGAAVDGPVRIAAGPDGNLWFTNNGDPSIGRITTAGMLTRFTDPDISTPWGITPGPDGNLWFANSTSIGRIVPADGDRYHPLPAPQRIGDSRPPPEQVGPYATPWGAGQTREVTVAGGATGVPADATAVVLNVTVTATTAPSFLTLWPKGAPARPTASNLNWSAGQTIPNAVTVKVGDLGTVNVFNNAGAANVLIDVVGWYDQSGNGAGYTALEPTRVLDSRPPPEQVGPFATPWGPSTDREVTVAGPGTPVPADADAVVLNATVTATTAESFLTVYPNGATKPTASSLNWKAGTTIPNAVTVKVGTDGKVRVFNNSGSAHVILDVVGYFKTGTGDAFHPVTPTRFQDSRPPPEQVGAHSTPWATGTTRTVAVTTGLAVPSGATAVLANVTVTTTSAESFLTVWNTGAPTRPTASNLNWKAGVTIANAVTAKVGTADTISVYNNTGSVHVIADAAGWYG